MTFADDDAEKPLDPAAEKLRRKMTRLLAVSIGIMMIGLMAVLVAVVYKGKGARNTGLPAAGNETPIMLPHDSTVVESSLDGERMLLRTQSPNGSKLYLISLSDGAVLASYRLEENGQGTR